MVRKFNDLTGRQFNRWEVIGRGEDYIYPSSGKRAPRWNCLCTCGTEKLVHGAHLLNGSSQSCGCFSWEISTTHGLSKTKAYKAWSNMMERCYNPTKKDSKHYKDKGVSVCERWHSVENFFDDMGECPEGFELERLDYTESYSPENCIWTSEQVQAENRGKFANNTSGKTGVTWSELHGKWRAYLYHKKKKYDGGLFESFDEATARRKELELTVLGYEKDH